MPNYNKNLINEIASVIEQLEDYEKVNLHNLYCEYINDGDSILIDMEMFDEYLEGQTPTWIAERIYYGEFSPADDYFYFNGYGNLKSINIYDIDCVLYASDIADYVVRHWDSLECDELQEILDEYDKNLESEEE